MEVHSTTTVKSKTIVKSTTTVTSTATVKSTAVTRAAPVPDQDQAQHSQVDTTRQQPQQSRPWLRTAYVAIALVLLFINYFLSQYDKFILSYFQDSLSADLGLSATQYAVLSGYATGIVYALMALPIAYLADYLPVARVFVLCLASALWSVCVVFQSLSHSFWQILLARIAMGICQSAVEPLSISLISDLIGGWRNVFVGSSVFYVGVYIGEAISGQIATAFDHSGQSWRLALRSIGITGTVVSLILRIWMRVEPRRKLGLLEQDTPDPLEQGTPAQRWRLAFAHFKQHRGLAWPHLRDTLAHLAALRSFWLLVLSASLRQLAGNVFGYYMPAYLSDTYPTEPDLLSRYGIIVGVVGSASVLAGGALTAALWPRTPLTPLYLTALGGVLSAPFVLLMIFSRALAPGPDPARATHILYGTMAAAYLTAELWLGALAGLVAALLPARHKTFGLAIWASVQALVYASGPEIVGLALRATPPGSEGYVRGVRAVLAAVIPACYCLAAAGFLAAVPLLRADLARGVVAGPVSRRKRAALGAGAATIGAVVVGLFVADVTVAARG